MDRSTAAFTQRPQTPKDQRKNELELNQRGGLGVGAGGCDTGPPSRYPIGVRRVLEGGRGLRQQSWPRAGRRGPWAGEGNGEGRRRGVSAAGAAAMLAAAALRVAL